MLKATGSAASILVPQDLGETDDAKGRRKKTRAEELRSGTLFGQYQLRGSLLVIKDNQSSVSGFIAFGTDMTTIPTTSASGSGVYIDYSGIYGLNGGTKQFYLQASDGKAYAGAGAVVLDSSGINLGLGSSGNWIRWGSGVAVINTYQTSATNHFYATALGDATRDEAEAAINAISNLGTLAKVYAHAQDSGGFGDANLQGTTTATLTMIGNGSTIGYGRFFTKNGVSISNAAQVNASSLLHLSSTAPTFRMEDTTTSAKSLLVTTDANLTKFEEVGGAAANLLVLDLANARVGIGAAPGASVLSITGLPTSAAGLSTGDVWNNGGILTIV